MKRALAAIAAVVLVFVIFQSCNQKNTGYAPDPALPFLFPVATTTHVDFGSGRPFNGTSESYQTEISVKTSDTFSLVVVFKANDTNTLGHIVWEGKSTGNGWGNTMATPDPELNISIGNVCDDPTHVNCPAQTVSPQANLLSFYMGDTQQGESTGVLNIATAFTDTASYHVVQVSVENLSTAPVARMYLDGALVGEDLVGTAARLSRSSWNNLLKVAGPGATQRFFNGTVAQFSATLQTTTALEAAALCRYYATSYAITCR